MKFYQENKVNPFGLVPAAGAPAAGLLLAVLHAAQGPASWTSARGSSSPPAHARDTTVTHSACDKVDPGRAQFLFIPDLTAKATGAVLVVLLVLYVGSQLLSIAAHVRDGGPNQRDHHAGAAVRVRVFIIRFPAGLLVYWITTNLWTDRPAVRDPRERRVARARRARARRWRAAAAAARCGPSKAGRGRRRPRRRRQGEGQRARRRPRAPSGARRPRHRRRASGGRRRPGGGDDERRRGERRPARCSRRSSRRSGSRASRRGRERRRGVHGHRARARTSACSSAATARRSTQCSTSPFASRSPATATRRDRASSIDAEGYRARRAEALQRQADQAADEALRYGRPVAMDAMTASERKLVHEYLRERGGRGDPQRGR